MGLRGEVFLHTLRNFRLAWIGGRYGGGKTALAVRLGYEFKRRGWCEHIIGNFPSVLFTSLDRLSELRDVFVILDEAGAWMREGEFDEVVAFLRKRNVTVVMPSVLPPPIKARSLNIQRAINYRTIGINLWLYTVDLKYMRVHERSKLWWFSPTEIFGLWDTDYVTIDSQGITGLFTATFAAATSNFRWDQELHYGPGGEIVKDTLTAGSDGRIDPGIKRTFRTGHGDGGLDEIRRIGEDLYETTERFEEAVSVARKFRRGRRY